jgi:hypothetical protein
MAAARAAAARWCTTGSKIVPQLGQVMGFLERS